MFNSEAEVQRLNQQLHAETARRQRAEQAQREAEEALQQARDELQAIVDAIPGGVSWINIDLRYVGANRWLASTYNLTPDAFIGKPVGFLHNSPHFSDWVRQFFSAPEMTASQELEIDVDGERCVYLIAGQKYLAGKAAVFVGIDITERKQIEEQIRHDALHDKLTGLPNRTLFMDRLGQSIRRTRRDPEHSSALLFLDLDRFKVVNDSLGHPAGDQLLIAVARRLEECLRPGDTVARLGGDEFVILLEDTLDVNDAIKVADRIQTELAVPVEWQCQQLFTSASIGIALGGTAYTDPDDLLRDADTAMYRAKAQGKACYEIFNTTMYTDVVQRLEWETELRRALENGEFQVCYQPIVSFSNQHIKGFEALVRWQHPQRGLILPQEFLAHAEETGLIVAIDRWVLRTACAHMKTWQDLTTHNGDSQEAQQQADVPLTISVNFSHRNFSHADTVDYIEQILRETGIAAGSLKLEISENALITNCEATAAMLAKLQATGVQMSMDDSGPVYSALSYLHRFSLNTLKMDRAFISRLDDDSTYEILRAVVSLAHNLGIEVIAEGVETAQQISQLQLLQCESGQGSFFSGPVDSETVQALLSTEQRSRFL